MIATHSYLITHIMALYYIFSVGYVLSISIFVNAYIYTLNKGYILKRINDHLLVIDIIIGEACSMMLMFELCMVAVRRAYEAMNTAVYN